MVTQRPSARSLQTDGKVGLQFASCRYGAHRNTPGQLCRYEICKGGGQGFRSAGCGNDGGRDMNPIGCSRTRLSSSSLGRGRSPGPPVTQEALGRPGVSISCRCATSLAIRRSYASPTRVHHHLRVIPYRLIGIATSIRNGTDGLGEPTA